MAKNILLLVTGSEAPGLCAAQIEIMQRAHAAGHNVFLCDNGYPGLVQGGPNIFRMDPKDPRFQPSNIGRGGSFTQVSRKSLQPEIAKDPSVLQRVLNNLQGVDVLVVFGGNGSMIQLGEIQKRYGERGFPYVVGVPRTIDGDVPHTDRMLGANTAIYTAAEKLEALYRSAEASGRTIMVEMMGRDAPFLIYLATLKALERIDPKGAEYPIPAIIAPGHVADVHFIARRLQELKANGARGFVIPVSEGALDLKGNSFLLKGQPQIDGIEKAPNAAGAYREYLEAAGWPVYSAREIIAYELRGAKAHADDIKLAAVIAETLIDTLAFERMPEGMLSISGDRASILPFSQLHLEKRILAADDPVYEALRDAGVLLGHQPEPLNRRAREFALSGPVALRAHGLQHAAL